MLRRAEVIRQSVWRIVFPNGSLSTLTGQAATCACSMQGLCCMLHAATIEVSYDECMYANGLLISARVRMVVRLSCFSALTDCLRRTELRLRLLDVLDVCMMYITHSGVGESL